MKPRIAWVCPYLPAPRTSGGALRIQQLARGLSAHYELSLYCRGEVWEASRLATEELSMFSARWLGRDWWPNSERHLPRRVRRGSPRRLYRRVAADHRQRPFAALIVEHAWAALGANELGLPVLLDEHNVESAYLADWFSARGKHGARVQAEVRRMQTHEQRLWAQVSQVTCVSPEDLDAIGQHRQGNTTLVPNGVDISKTTWHGSAERTASVLFVGALSHAPNLAAAKRLTQDIMPLVWQTRPDVSLDVVGPNPPAALLALNDSRVRVHGRVPDVTRFLARAGAFAFPLAHGAGSSLKTIEALAAGAPLITNGLGARGYPLTPHEHYLPAETNAEFARAILAVLATPQRFEAMAKQGRRVAEPYDWRAICSVFGQCLERAITGAGTPALPDRRPEG